MERAGKRLESRQNALSVALKSGDKESIAKAKKSLEDAQRAVTFHDTKYKAMVEDTALRISKANQTALDYVNGKTPNIYANNFNQINGDAKKVGIKFTTINEDVVRKRIAEGDIKLPKPRVSVPKDVRWNTKKMNSAVLQGILQGESMNDIAKRLLPIVDSNASSAIRNARTLVTQAENSGRLDSYKALEEEGAVLKKVWMATGDDRTRIAHLMLDGQEVDIDEMFEDEDGNELRFPADPWADPSTVYNCRCTMITHIVAVKDENGIPHFVDEDENISQHEREIDREKQERAEQEKLREAQQEEKWKDNLPWNWSDKPVPDSFVDDLRKSSNKDDQNFARAMTTRAKYQPVSVLKRPMTEKETIEKLCGGDKTKGSCVSLAYAYAGNKHGLDVLDFRGGDSQHLFAYTWDGISKYFGGINVEGSNDFTACHKLFKKVEEGKEYILSTGRHTSVIRRTQSGLEYLELQSYRENGWKALDDSVLKSRFACKKQHTYNYGQKYEVDNTLIDIDKLKDNETFRGMLGYINTDPAKQKKGLGGHVK